MHVFQVSEFIAYFNDAVRSFMNEQQMAIEGEIAEFRVSQGKFAWFKLKDPEGVIDCFAMTFVLKVPVEEGMKVRVSGYPKIYQRSGKFSINVTRLELVGEGALKRAFELMKKKLAAEGLFAPERKRALPRYPERIGLITSGEAAAYTDFLRILNNRWGGLDIKLADVAVQGKDAVAEIVGAFRWFNAHAAEFDVLVLTRGGGAMEDLAAFNDEAVARAIFSSKIPVVVGVGHERDETIADYVADLRASTPSNAAERLVPDRREALYALAVQPRIMFSALERTLGAGNRRLAQAVDRMETAVRRESRGVADAIHAFALAGARFEDVVRGRSQRVTALERLLNSLDPNAVLKRGYSITRLANGKILRDARVTEGTELKTTLAAGQVVSRVIRKQGSLFADREE
ncbi:exodeoxyribonuclease VII large subunit [Patescibacteria group bacterium]|nr:MAG: exodeoxyribonuclease VII large subunit [Patescibacteria group bacterium]